MRAARLWLAASFIACAPQRPATTTEPSPPARSEAAAQGPHAHGGGATAGATPFASLSSLSRGAQVFPDLGMHHRQVTTSSQAAQVYFDQGLRLAYGFNHDEAARSFARAAEIDPTCAMCFWGVAFTLGPNYNVPMLPERTHTMWQALGQARARAAQSTAVERALIEALITRYKGPEPIEQAEQHTFDVEYANAMRAVARRFPDDDDVQVLFAESLMDTNPWKLWSPDGEPAPGTPEITGTLERVLLRAPNHPGANHFYIHAIEASSHPDKGLPSAQRLAGLMPGAGHIVHMPAHIYQRVGRYAEASDHNRRAAEIDEQYLRRTTPPGYYPMYVGHNYGFLAYSASMEGRGAESLAASRRSAHALPIALVCAMPGFDFFAAEPLLVMVRFGRWNELLMEPRPPEKYEIQSGLWLHAHGMALASLGRTDEARADLEALAKLKGEVPAELRANLNPAPRVLDVAEAMLKARIAEKEGRVADAIGLYGEAVGLEDRLSYAEPADWFYPTRHFLGAALLDANRPAEAEAVYQHDLEKHPQNGWALFGLWKSLEAQHKSQAREARAAFEAAWSGADTSLTRSAF